jgi:hypothetical protein
VTAKEFKTLLTNILRCHPEAKDAEVWAGRGREALHIKYVRYTNKRKPSRIVLEE